MTERGAAARLPWDVFASPIVARKLARLGTEHGRIVLRPAFFRQLGGPYEVAARAWCPFRDHPAPQADCSCGFYAVSDDADLWRLGADDPELAVLEVELAGRVIEHDHGYRASDQRVRTVVVHGACARCGAEATTLHRRRFGALVPACDRCAKRPYAVDVVSRSLGAPVSFEREGVKPAPRLTRLRFVLAQILVPVLALVLGAVFAAALQSAAPLAIAQVGILTWLLCGPFLFDRLAGRFGIAAIEAARLRRRWSGLVIAVAIACDIGLTVAAVSVWHAVAS